MYLIDREVEWVLGVADDEDVVLQNREFSSSGMFGFRDGLHGSIRTGAPFVRITGERGELTFNWNRFQLFQDIEGPGGTERLQVALPEPVFLGEWSPLYSIDNVVQCIDSGAEPRVSGRRVRNAMEIQIAMGESHRLGSARVDLPLQDRSLGMVYEWFR